MVRAGRTSHQQVPGISPGHPVRLLQRVRIPVLALMIARAAQPPEIPAVAREAPVLTTGPVQVTVQITPAWTGRVTPGSDRQLEAASTVRTAHVAEDAAASRSKTL